MRELKTETRFHPRCYVKLVTRFSFRGELLRQRRRGDSITRSYERGSAKDCTRSTLSTSLYVVARRERKVPREKEEERRKERRAGGEGHVKNCTSAYISPATSGVTHAISRRWEPEPGRVPFLSLSGPFCTLSPSFTPNIFFFGGALTDGRHAPLRGERSLMLHSAR